MKWQKKFTSIGSARRGGSTKDQKAKLSGLFIYKCIVGTAPLLTLRLVRFILAYMVYLLTYERYIKGDCVRRFIHGAVFDVVCS